MYQLYVITDGELSEVSHQEQARLACEGGADVIQLRDKTMDKDGMIIVAKDIRRITSLHNVLFFVNDHMDAALASEADGIHLGQSDMRLADALELKGKMLIGISASSAEEALAAERGGADYIGLGPIFTTSSKNDAGEAIGIEELRRIRSMVKIPIVAIGGVTMENTPGIIEAGADGIAVISAVVSQKDIRNAAEEMKGIVSGAVRASTGRR
jgi:thiamine-phosphate pyrophosphorylase